MAKIISANLLNQESLFKLGLNFDLQFPEDLFAQKMGGNFMIFFINEQKALVGSQKNPVKTRRKVYDTNGKRVEMVAPRTVTANNTSVFSRRVNETTVTTGAIALFIPGKLDVNYSVKYEEVDLDFVMSSVIKGDLKQAFYGALSSITTKEGRLLLGTNLGKALGGSDFDKLMETAKKGGLGAFGVALNPFKQIFFNGLGFRKFSFDFSMMPRNQKEAQMINDIVEVFKYHMHPEEMEQAGGRFFISPSDFDIEFYRINANEDESGKTSANASVFENEFLFAISTCVLTDMSVNYTPASEGFITHHDGTPLGVNLRLSFTETEILTKKRIKELNKNKFMKEIAYPIVREGN